MCKVCVTCNGVMNYDPYFEAEVCGKCGRIERKNKDEIKKLFPNQPNGNDILRQIMGTMMAQS